MCPLKSGPASWQSNLLDNRVGTYVHKHPPIGHWWEHSNNCKRVKGWDNLLLFLFAYKTSSNPGYSSESRMNQSILFIMNSSQEPPFTGDDHFGQFDADHAFVPLPHSFFLHIYAKPRRGHILEAVGKRYSASFSAFPFEDPHYVPSTPSSRTIYLFTAISWILNHSINFRARTNQAPGVRAGRFAPNRVWGHRRSERDYMVNRKMIETDWTMHVKMWRTCVAALIGSDMGFGALNNCFWNSSMRGPWTDHYSHWRLSRGSKRVEGNSVREWTVVNSLEGRLL